MNIKLIDRGTEGELLFDGRLESVTAPETEEILLQMTEKYDSLILNMEKLEYISSAGLRIMKKAHMAMRKKDGKLVLTHVNNMVMEVFEMTGFAGFLKFN